MNADRWPRVKEIFHDALERAPAERSRFVAEACGGDAALQAEVERLLAAHDQAGSFIEQSPVAGTGENPKPAAGRCLTTGQVRGHYEILRLIGVGGMGEVYAARDLELGRTVALKVVTGDNADAQKALRREAQHASRLNHPHICTIHEVGEADGQCYIVMEYVDGQRLSDLIFGGSERTRPTYEPPGLPIEMMLRYGIQIADALAHAHRNGVIHRDLKSANVVITPDGRAKVLDFGLARRLPAARLTELSQSQDSLTAEGVVSGTLSYMAPELLRGEQADARSDIWALGVLLYEMAAGARPFAGVTGFELSAAILHDPPAPLPARIPASLKDIIGRCLAKDPRERYKQADEVRSALETAQARVAGDAVPIPAVPIPTVGRMRRLLNPLNPFRSRRAAWIWGVFLALNVLHLLWHATRQDPVAVGASGRPAIAVLNFTNAGNAENQDTAWLSSGVPSMLLTDLAQTEGLEIVSPQRLSDAARQMGEKSVDSLDKQQSADVARRAGAGAIVLGSIFRVGDQIRIDAQLEDLSTGRILAAESVRGTDVFALVDQLSARIRDGAGFRGATGIRGVAEISSASLEAQRLYAIGTQASANVRYGEAQKSLEAAVAIDPTFADAYVRLAFVYLTTGQMNAWRAILRKATEHADRLSERVRLGLKLVTATDNGNFAEAGQLVDEMLAKYPDLDIAYVIAEILYRPQFGPLSNGEKLLAIHRQGTIALSASTMVRNSYGYSLLDAGRYADAIREFEAYARLAPREPNPYDSLGEAYLIMGYPEKAIENYSRALAIDPTFLGAHNGRALSLATLGRYDEAIAEDPPLPHFKALLLSRVGRYREADKTIAAGLLQAESRENPAETAALSLWSAALAIDRKQQVRALEATQSAAKSIAQFHSPQQRPLLMAVDLFAGAAEVGRGRLDEARSHLESLGRTYQPAAPGENWWHSALAGEIALAAGDLQNAGAMFSASEPSMKLFRVGWRPASTLANAGLFRDGLARVAIARGDLTGAIQIYRQLLKYGPDQKWVDVFEPRYVLEIARLLERTGDTRAARQEYDRFLTFWKGADQDLPELAEARRAVARIGPLDRTGP